MPDTLDAVFRREAGRCTATLIRVLGDVDSAQDAVAEAFALAAQRWPRDGIPPNPGGWIVTTARNRAIDRARREASRAVHVLSAHRLYGHDMQPEHNPEHDQLDDFVDVVADDQFLAKPLGDVRIDAARILADELDLLAGDSIAVLLHERIFSTLDI